MNDIKLMAHMIAGYPDYDESLAVARALVRGGADYLEIQFPFSDPSADGPVIERASHVALANGFRLADGFRLISTLAKETDVPIFIMTYASLVFTGGIENFVRTAAEASVSGLVIPDLPPDYDEGLYNAGKAAGVVITPVLSPAMTKERLEFIKKLKPEYVYTALRVGVTGKATDLDEATLAYLDDVSAIGAKIIAGFGVRTKEQMRMLSGKAYASAVGSYFLEEMTNSGDPLKALEKACRNLKESA